MYYVYKTRKISDSLYQIQEKHSDKAPAVYMYLVIGEDKAAMIDTGFGVVDYLRSEIDKITDKPVVCILTHGHPDHAGAAALFDDIWMHPDDGPIVMENISYERREMDCFGRGDVDDDLHAYCEEHMVITDSLNYKPMRAGDVFDLGGITLEVYEIPGHTKGSVALFNKKDNYAMIGDAFAPHTAPEERVDLADYADGLETFDKAINDDTLLYYGHSEEPLDHCYLKDTAAACREILAGMGENDPLDLPKHKKEDDGGPKGPKPGEGPKGPKPGPKKPVRYEHVTGTVSLGYIKK